MSGRSQVPELVGLSVEDAHDSALDAGLLAVEQDDSDPDAGEWGSTGGTTPVRRVYRQEPSPGKAVATGARVGIWARRPDDPGPDDGGGGGGGSDLTPTGPAPQSGKGTK